MDAALSVYIFGYWAFNENEENYTNLKIAMLFREFLNFIGWDQIKLLANYKIVENVSNMNEEYSKNMLAENLPELSDDFVGVFLKSSAPGLENNFAQVKQFITEFCNLLYNENLINYIIEPIE